MKGHYYLGLIVSDNPADCCTARCSCGAKFDAKTVQRRRALHRDHVDEISGKKAHRLFVLHVYGDVDPAIIAGPLSSRAACLTAAKNHLGNNPDADPEGGYFILRSTQGGNHMEAESFTGSELDEAREKVQGAKA